MKLEILAKPKLKFFFLVALLIVTNLLIVLYCQYPSIGDELIVHSDVNTFFPAILKQIDPKLFPNDLLTGYIHDITPKGYILLMWFLGHFTGLIFLAKTLPFLLALISAAWFFLLAKEMLEDWPAFFSAVLFSFYSWTFQTFQGLTPRAFIYPLLIPLVYFLIKKKYILALLPYSLQAFFYPPAFLVSSLAFLSIGMKEAFDRKKFLTLFLASVVTILHLFYLWQSNILVERNYGPVLRFRQMIDMAEFYPGGKEPFFFNNIWLFLASKRAGIELNAALGLLFIILFFLMLCNRKKPHKISQPKELNIFLASGIIFYVFAQAVLLRLYFPARYLIFILPVFICILIGVALERLSGNPKPKTKVLFFTLSVILFLPHIGGRFEDYRYMRQALKFFANTPGAYVIAASPSVSEPISLFSRKQVLFSRRLLMPFHASYYNSVKNRALDFYDAYYSDSSKKIKDFCLKYSVDYILFQRREFSPEYLKNIAENEPFNSYIKRITEGKKKFFLPSIDKTKICFEEYGIVAVKALQLD